MSLKSFNINDKLGSTSIGRLLWEYSVPAVIGNLVMALYNIVDRVFIGQGVGAMAISGLALTFPFFNILIAFSMLVGVGAAARISIRLGENDFHRAEKILGNAFVLILIISAVIITLSMLYLDDILMLFGGSEKTIPYARDYMKIIIPGSVISALSYGFNNIMRATGFPQKAMYTMLISALVNVILDPIFIFGFDMGIAGAAYATNIAYLVSMTWVLSHFVGGKSPIKFKKPNFKLDKSIVRSILDIGMSPFSMQVATSFVVMIINLRLLTYGGDLAIGALGIQNSISIFIVMIILGINQGTQPILGYNYGAQQYHRMFAALKKTAIAATIITTIGFLLVMFFPRAVTSIFTTDSKLTEISVDALRISLIVFPLVGSQIVLTNFFQSIGKAKISIFLSLTRQVLFLIPALIVLPNFFGLNGVWGAMPISDFVAVIVTSSTFTYFYKKFKREHL